MEVADEDHDILTVSTANLTSVADSSADGRLANLTEANPSSSPVPLDQPRSSGSERLDGDASRNFPADLYGFESGGIASYVVPQPEPEAEVIEALDVVPEIQVIEEETKNKRLYLLGWMFLLVMIVAVMAATVAVILNKRKGNDESNVASDVTKIPTPLSSQAPSISPTNSFYVELLSTIEVPYLGNEQLLMALSNKSSPQYRAVTWVADTASDAGINMTGSRAVNRFALATFYFATNGDEWVACGRGSTNCDVSQEWLTATNECDWYAIKCSDDGSTITGIYFPTKGESSNNIRGTLPFELSFLSDLATFIIARGPLSGTFPDWSSLTSLEQLILNENKITGDFPGYLLQANPSLKTIQFHDNGFRGPLFRKGIPLDSSLLTDLTLSSNEFTGSISSEIEKLSSLRKLDLRNNEFTGTLPTELFSIGNLTSLDLNGNKGLYGELSPLIDNISQLIHFDVANTGLGGTLPIELFSLSKLRVLDLSFSNFDGPLSISFSQLTDLDAVILNNNGFTGPIPPGFDALPFLEFLELHQNNLSGSISKALCDRRGEGFGDIQSLTVDCEKVTCACCTNCTSGATR